MELPASHALSFRHATSLSSYSESSQIFSTVDVAALSHPCSCSNPSCRLWSAIPVINSLLHEDGGIGGIIVVSVLKASSEVCRHSFSSTLETHRKECLFDFCETTHKEVLMY